MDEFPQTHKKKMIGAETAAKIQIISETITLLDGLFQKNDAIDHILYETAVSILIFDASSLTISIGRLFGYGCAYISVVTQAMKQSSE